MDCLETIDSFEWKTYNAHVEIKVDCFEEYKECRCYLELWVWFPGSEEVDLVFDRDSFLDGNIWDFIAKKGEGYEIYSYAPKGGAEVYYLRKIE